MKPKTLALLAVAGGCGLVAMLGVQQAMQGGGAAPKVQTARVLVATAEIDTGMRLTEDNVTFAQKPLDVIPELAVVKEEDFLERAARYPLQAGEIIRASDLTERGGYGKSIEIPPGMRVITINVDSTHTASGLIRPGDRVDVLVMYRSKSERGLPVSKTKTLLEYIEVFATDDQTASKIEATDPKNAKSHQTKYVSLLLTPEQVNFVKLAETKGTLSLSWRHRLDDELVQTKDIDDKLLEELEGTVGVNEDRPLYDQAYGAAFVDTETPQDLDRRNELEGTTSPSAKQKPSQFLDSVQENGNVPGAPTNTVAAVVPAIDPENLWTIQVYNGNSAVPQHFDITPPPEEKPEGSLTDMFKSLFGSGNTSAADNTQSDVVEVPVDAS